MIQKTKGGFLIDDATAVRIEAALKLADETSDLFPTWIDGYPVSVEDLDDALGHPDVRDFRSEVKVRLAPVL